MVDTSIAQASDSASPAQIAILERAKSADEVVFSDVQEAVNNAFACMEQVNVKGTWLPPDTSNGFPIPTYGYGASLDRPESEWLPVAEECIKRESAIVEWLYQLQPASESLKAEYYKTVHKPRIVACLKEHGKEVPDDATRAEIDELVIEVYDETSGMVYTETDNGSEGVPTTPDEAVECYLDTL